MLYRWVAGKLKPNITPVKLIKEFLPFMVYLASVICGGYRRITGGLCITDKEFAEHFEMAYERVTGKRPTIRCAKDGFWKTGENGA